MKFIKSYNKHINESSNEKNLDVPTKEGWYWVLLDGYESPTPCWFMKMGNDWCFLPGGMGDSSSMGLYADDITKIGPSIEVPNF